MTQDIYPKKNNIYIYNLTLKNKNITIEIKNNSNIKKETEIKRFNLLILKTIKNFTLQKNIKLQEIIQKFSIEYNEMKDIACFKSNNDFENIILEFSIKKLLKKSNQNIISTIEHELYHIKSSFYHYENELYKELKQKQKEYSINSKIRHNRDKKLNSQFLQTYLTFFDRYKLDKKIRDEIIINYYYFYKNFSNLIADAFLTIIAQKENNKEYIKYCIRNDQENFKRLKKRLKYYNKKLKKAKSKNQLAINFLLKSNKFILFILFTNHCPKESISLIHNNNNNNNNNLIEEKKLAIDLLNKYLKYIKSFNHDVYKEFYKFYFYFINSININLDIKTNQINKQIENNEQIKLISEKALKYYHFTLEKFHNEIEILFK